MIGHRVLPVVGLCPGYRHVALRTECGQPLPLASLFLHVIVKDYVPDGLSDFAEALANPIKYQSQIEKRGKQLAVLTDDLEEPPEGEVEVIIFFFSSMSIFTSSSNLKLSCDENGFSQVLDISSYPPNPSITF